MILKIPYRVKFFDTDVMGVAHHSNYFRWFETARVEFLRELSISLNDFMNDGILFPIIEVDAKFHAPAHFDDELEIEIAPEVLSKAKMKFNYAIRHCNSDKILVEGSSTNVFTHDGKICRLPDKFFERLVKGLQ